MDVVRYINATQNEDEQLPIRKWIFDQFHLAGDMVLLVGRVYQNEKLVTNMADKLIEESPHKVTEISSLILSKEKKVKYIYI